MIYRNSIQTTEKHFCLPATAAEEEDEDDQDENRSCSYSDDDGQFLK